MHEQMNRIKTLTGLSGLFLASCAGLAPPDVAQLSEPKLRVSRQIAPPNAAPGTCWGRDVTPAMIETVTEQVLLRPAKIAADGTVITPAAYKTETKQAILRERQKIWFETPCPESIGPDFVATLQRALKARGLLRGAITGAVDERTLRAIRLFQKPQGLDSSILSLAAARKLGLVAVERTKDGKG